MGPGQQVVAGRLRALLRAGKNLVSGLPSLSGLLGVALAVSLALGAGGTLWYRGQYEGEKAARAQDLAAALSAEASAKAADAQKTRALETQYGQQIAKLKEQANARTFAIAEAPDSDACASSAAMRALFGGLRDRATPGAGAAGSAGRARAAVP